MLPDLVGEGALPTPARGQGRQDGVPFAVEEHRLEPVWLDLFQGLQLLADPCAELSNMCIRATVEPAMACADRLDAPGELVFDKPRSTPTVPTGRRGHPWPAVGGLWFRLVGSRVASASR